MKVKELIELLKGFNENAEVRIVKKDNMGEFLGEIYSIKGNNGKIEIK